MSKRLNPADRALLAALEASRFSVEHLEKTARSWEEQAERAESPEQKEACEKSAARCRHTANLLKGAGR